MKRLMMWTGPVSSAKSTAALGMAHRFVTMGLCVVLVRPECSVRDHEEIGTFRTKNGMPWPALEVNYADEIFPEVDEKIPHSDVVWIDEPALIKERKDGDLFRAVNWMREEFNVMVSGIASTSELEPFGSSTGKLLAVADEIIPCRGDCPFCKGINNATRSLYMGASPKSGQALVGGADVYQPACVDCWNEMISVPALERKIWFGKLVRGGLGVVCETTRPS